MSIVLGCSYAKVKCESEGRLREFSLPLTNLNGKQIETHEVKRIRHYLQGLDIDNPTEQISERVLGYRITWDLSFSEFIDGNDVVKFYDILKLYKAGYTITFIPREDQDWRYFEVIPDNETLSLGITSAGYYGFNDNFVFRFVTKNLEPDLKISVIAPPSITIYSYGDSNFEEVLYEV